MGKRLRAVKGLYYPDAKSLAAVVKACGLSKMTPAQRDRLTFVRVEPGDWCDDVPKSSRAGLLASNKIEEVDASNAGRKK